MIEEDNFRTILYFATENEKQATTEATMEVSMQVQKLIFTCNGENTKKELMEKLKLKNQEYFRLEYLQPALKDRLIEMKFPERPNHPKQKYRLTEKGLLLKTSLENKR